MGSSLLLISLLALGSLRSLFANAHVPANAGVVFNGYAVGDCGGTRGGCATQEPGSRDAAQLLDSAKYWHTRPQGARYGLFIVAATILPTRDAKSARGAQNRPFQCQWHGRGTDAGQS